MLIHDTAAAMSRLVTPEGFLRVRARIGRTGVHLYRAAELGVTDASDPNRAIRVYRPPDAVFDAHAMASFAAKPVTDDHPPSLVDATNWKRYAVGQSGAEVTREGDHLVTDLLITDADAVQRAEAGAQLSNGYLADFDFTPGETPEGEAYDAVQSNIRGNHIALVDAGRCGETCRIGDTATVADCGCGSMAPAPTTVTIDGIAIEATAESAAALDRLRRAVEAKDGAIAALMARISDEAALDARVVERTAVIDAARAMLGPRFSAEAMSTAAIRREVVTRYLGTPLDGRSDAYVEAAFDTLRASRPAPNPLATHLATGATSTRESARHDRDRFLTDAWKGDQSHGVR